MPGSECVRRRQMQECAKSRQTVCGAWQPQATDTISAEQVVQPVWQKHAVRPAGFTVFASTDEALAASRVVHAGVTIPRIRVHP